MPVEPFSIPSFEPAVGDLRSRLRRMRWPDEIRAASWEYGVDLSFLREICSYWAEEYDWNRQAELLSRFHHYRYIAGDFGIHFIHERGKGPAPIPLLLTHGWPGSFIEMLRIIPMLTDPAADDRGSQSSFDVIVPSLPGFGFSDLPMLVGMNALGVGEVWAALMTELGYDRFAAQGGDLGAGVCTALGLRHGERLIGIHLNFIPGSYRPHFDSKPTPTEETFMRDIAQWGEESGAYSHIQRTRPQTAAYALNDSPAGLAAWILEKFREWSDCDGDIYRIFSRDDLLTNVSLYWFTETINSSFRMYFENRKAPLQFRPGDFLHTPCAIAHFPKEILFPPREWVARGYNVKRWTEMSRGGHFAAMEQPELLAADLRAFFSSATDAADKYEAR